VLREISASTVWLADPSLGNRTYSRSQFLAMWGTRTGEPENAGLKGRVFAVLPIAPGPAAQTDFFTETPRRQTAQAIAQIEALECPVKRKPSLAWLSFQPRGFWKPH